MTLPDPLDLVVCSLEPWDEVWRRNQFLVAGLLRENPGLRVMFVEPPEDPAYMVKLRMRPRLGSGLNLITDVPGVDGDRLWSFQPTKWLPRSIDRAADDRLARNTMRAASRLGFVRPVLWINNPSTVALLERSRWPAVYDITDDWLMADRSDSEHQLVAEAEAVLMDRCAVVTVCSPGLMRTKGAHRTVRLLPNGVDVRRYREPAPRPADLPAGKVALYVGTVHPDRIDVELCERTARHLVSTGAGTLVVVGSYQLSGEDRDRLRDAGLVALGTRPNADVPAYLQHADVLVVPHVVSDFTESLDPIKLYEYRAVGRPVIATPVAGFRDGPQGQISAVPAGSFPAAVADALATADASTGPAYLAQDVPDWSERVRTMAQVLRDVAERR